jgi:hypothetical protein
MIGWNQKSNALGTRRAAIDLSVPSTPLGKEALMMQNRVNVCLCERTNLE